MTQNYLSQKSISSPALDNHSVLRGVFLFLLPGLYLYQGEFIGRVVWFEVFFSFFGAASVLLIARGEDKPINRLVLMGLIWLVFQIFTDILRSTEFNDLAKGWARIFFFLTNLGLLWWAINYKVRFIFAFACGYFFFSFWSSLYGNGFEFNPYTWKVGWMIPGSGSLILLASLSRGRFLSSAIMLLAAAINVYFEARAMAGVCAVTALFLLVSDVIRLLGALRTGISGRLQITFSAISLVAAFFFLALFSHVAAAGFFGDSLKVKSEQQIRLGERYVDGPLGWILAPLIGGRVEVIVSTRAIIDSPLIGHGSWAKNPEYFELYASLGGLDIDKLHEQAGEYDDLSLIPTHSHFFGGWVESGFGGAAFWSVILFFIGRALYVLLVLRVQFQALFVFFIVSAGWDVLFSPFDTPRRLLMPFFIVMLCFVLKSWRNYFNASRI